MTLQVRIGVNTGEVLATTEPRPGEAMATGDTVNAAARLQGAAEPGTIVIGERTARGARGSFRLEPLGPLELKGKAQPVSAFLVVEELELAPGRGVPGLHAPARRSRLRARAAPQHLRSRGRRGPAEPGHGLRRRGGGQEPSHAGVPRRGLEGTDPAPRTVRGRCLPYGDGITYWPLAEILKSTASVLDTDPPDLALEKIAKVSDDVLTDEVTSDRARTTAALAYTVGVEDPAFGFGDMDPREVRARAPRGVALVLLRARRRGTDDRHRRGHPLGGRRAPRSPRRARGGRDGKRRVPLSRAPGAHRPAGPAGEAGDATSPRSRSIRSIIDEAEHLIRALLAIDDLPDRVRSRILERGEGNPFFLEEILRHLIDGGHVFFEAGRWRAASRGRRGGDPRHRAGRARGADRSPRADRQAPPAGRRRRRPRLLARPRSVCSAAPRPTTWMPRCACSRTAT